ncbi:MAG: ECF transporter S component [Eubacteriales bacterium]|nr:ECF transporter S component [Eubacteriales bacterium]MDY3332286.1 ECF transporter S component [Gallibacter sp.]
MNNTNKKTSELVIMALFSGIIIVLAFTPFIGYIPLGFTRATIVHIPVIIGSLILGPKKGAVLGGVFGMTSLINNTINPTVTSFVFTPFYSFGEISGGISSIIICFVPRILVGIVPYYVYKLVKGRSNEISRTRNITSLACAGVAGSMTNTLLVMGLIGTLFTEAYATAQGLTKEAIYTFISSVIAINGIPEAIVAGIIVIGIGLAFSKTKLAFHK